MGKERLPRIVRKKNRHKAFRVVLQYLLLILIAAVALRYTVFRDTYQPFAQRQDFIGTSAQSSVAVSQGTDKKPGFVAISYFGVALEGTRTLISQERLAEHLYALRDAGYVTISQQDILDFYYLGKALPPRALFLMFEDGRRESAMLAQPLLEECNFKATMFSYANNLDSHDNIFLNAGDLRILEKNTYWEMGTHGYRLSYVNVFDRHQNYLGELPPDEFVQLSPYFRREYNHFLMDFLRDEYDIPIESVEQMKKRVANDYELMQQEYRAKLGNTPGLYILMHSNTGQFATDSLVSVENERWMSQIFGMNFNREMFCFNDLDTDLYDLTRMQPQPTWTVNHLLTRIRDDTGEPLAFHEGEEVQARRWTVLSGAAQYKPEVIELTSESEGRGWMHLNHSQFAGDFSISTYLDGNKLGNQAIDLWVDEGGDQSVAVEIASNVLRVYQAQGADLKSMLFQQNLDQHDGVVYQTWEENRQEALSAEIQVKGRQTERAANREYIIGKLERAKTDLSGVRQGPFVPEIKLLDQASRFVEIFVQKGKLSVQVDGKMAVKDLEIPAIAGGVALRVAWAEYGYSERNLADDVYDGVFRDMVIAPLKNGAPELEAALLDNRLQPKEQAVEWLQNVWHKIIRWVGKTL